MDQPNSRRESAPAPVKNEIHRLKSYLEQRLDTEEKHLPYLQAETDCSQQGVSQPAIRTAAFIELLAEGQR